MTKLDGKLTPEHFNSQPHEEADEMFSANFDIEKISTHSLTKRLTE